MTNPSISCADRSTQQRWGGDKDKLDGFRRLERFARAVETKRKPEADFDAVIAHENAISASLDGRSVFDDKPGQRFNLNRQRSLF